MEERKMKIITIFVIIGLISSIAWASELSQESLQGSWLIIEFAGLSDDEGDRWEFEGNKFYQNLGGKRTAPDRFKVVGKTIDLGYAKIIVKFFDGSVMEANMGGGDYKLKKE
jgi:hypothetical protein